MANTELRLYRYFVTLCEEENFSRAAERLAITPPTLTHQIQKLEKDLNVRLLNRKTKKKLQPTEAGLRFLESARDVLHLADEAEKTARKAARGEIGRLEIGYMITTAYSGLVQRFIKNFLNKYPRHRHYPAPGLDGKLGQRNIVERARRRLRARAQAVSHRSERLSVLSRARHSRVAGNHPLARKSGAIEPKALADEAFVSTSVGNDFAFTRHVEAIASLGGFVPKIAKRAEDLTTVLTYVSLGYGIAAVSQDMANCHVPNVIFKKLAAKAVPDVVFSFMHRTNESAPAVKALIGAMRELASKNDVSRGN